MLNKKTVAIYLASVFAAGLLAGGVAGFGLGKRRAFAPPPRPQDMATHICGRLKSKLHLTSEQERKVEPLVNEAAADFESIHAATGERIKEVSQKLNQRLADFLTPEQKILLEEMERERQQFFRREFKGKPVSPHSGAPLAKPD